jgi:DNA-binding transcriptional LysR family regulator
MMLHATPRRLAVFVAVVKNAGFSAAASALNVSQPSVSAHIRALEKSVRGPLFERVPGRAPRLTDAGCTLYAYALDTLERVENLSTQLGQTTVQLRFASQRFATSLLRKPLEAFSASFPHIELIAHTGTFEEVHAMFKSGAVDLAFILSNGEVPDLLTAPLGRYRLAFIATPDHPLAGQSRISPQRLAQHPFVAAYRNSYFGRTVASMLQAAGVPPLTIRSQAQEITMLREMVLAGMGVSVLMLRSAQSDLAAGTMVELDVDLDPMYLQLRYAKSQRGNASEIDSLVGMVRLSEGRTA